MSSLVFNRLRGPSIPFCCNGKNPLSRQYSAEPESVRIAANGCLYTIINNKVVSSNGKPPVPVSIVTTPSSNTTDNLRDAVLTEANNSYNPATRFGVFFSPPVPPPQFLQVPPTRVSYEPRAKIIPCVFARVPKSTALPPTLSSPDPPLLNGSGGNQNILLLWTIPADNGSPILDYEYSIDGIRYLSLNTLKKYATISGLVNGLTYNVSIRAINAFGAGQPSNTVEIIPSSVPDVPLQFSALGGNLVITLYWTAPYNGGVSITDYQYTTDGVTYSSLGIENTATAILLDSNGQPIRNNIQYSVALRAVNSYGPGPSTVTWRVTPNPDSVIILLIDIAVEDPSGIWTLSHDFTIPLSCELTIATGQMLIIPAYNTLINDGTLIINGTITNNGSIINNSMIYNNVDINLPLYVIAIEAPARTWTVIRNYTIVAIQTLYIPLRTTLIIPIGYTLTNNGTITIDGRLTTNNNLINNGTVVQNPPQIVNLASIARATSPTTWTLIANTLIDVGFLLSIPTATTLIIPLTGTLTIMGNLDIDGTLVNYGTLNNNGLITNNSNTILNYGIFTNNSQIQNIGTIVNNSGGTINNKASFNNSNTDSILTNLGTLTSFPGATFNNVGIFNTEDGISNWGTAPSAPILLSVTTRNASLTVTWTTPANGGFAITQYRYTLDNGLNYQVLGTDGIIRSLVNGQTYSVAIAARNSINTGPPSNYISGTPSAPPDPPTSVAATAGDRSISLTWIAPANVGGTPITDYQYTTDNGTSYMSLNTTTTSATINTLSADNTLLTNGTTYTVGIVAKNQAGVSLRGVANPVVPATNPDAPTALSASGGDQSIVLTWTASASTGGPPIITYQYTTDNGVTFKTFVPTGTTVTITTQSNNTTLVNGTPYSIAIRVFNSFYASPLSNYSTTTPATSPSAPTLVSATGGNLSIILSWAIPASTGGSNITGYEYTTNGGANYRSLNTVGTTATITTTSAATTPATTLVNGQLYTIAVRAINLKGPSNNSNALSAIPATIPGPPILTSAVGGRGSITLVWTGPTFTGGSPITDYEYTTDNGSTFLSLGTSGTTAIITRISSGSLPTAALVEFTSYTVKIRSVNSQGRSLALSGPLTATTLNAPTVPAAPILISATAGDQSIALVWVAPLDNGGNSITGYNYTTDNGANYLSLNTIGTSATISLTSSGTTLVNGVVYTIGVAAVNQVGSSIKSNLITVSPGGPMILTLTISATDVANPPVYLPLRFNAGQSVIIEWGDTQSNTWSSNSPSRPTHTYTAAGTYNLTITGTAYSFGYFPGATAQGITNNNNGPVAIVSVQSWLQSLTDLSHIFTNQPNNFTVPTYLPLNITNVSSMFANAIAFDRPLGSWNTTNVAGMRSMFSGARAFNQPLSSWDTSNVTDMVYMFANAVAFNSDIGTWNTRSVQNMSHMFNGAIKFNLPLTSNPSTNAWNTISVRDMSYMFDGAAAFNKPLSSWNTSSVNTMAGMFARNPSFNGDISLWNTTNVTDMNYMFYQATAFNQSLSLWNTSNVTNMTGMFYLASTFNQPLIRSGDIWNTARVTNMSNMFNGTTGFNQNINSWILSVLTDASYIFTSSAIGPNILNWPPFASRSPTIPDPNINSVYYGVAAVAPSAPTLISATGSDQAITLVWTPGFAGGSPITGYQYTTNGGEQYLSLNVTGTSGSITTTSTGTPLVNGTSYVIAIRAINQINSSQASNPITGIPAMVPGTPVVSMVVGDKNITFSWTVAANGSPITDYQYSYRSNQAYISLGPSATSINITTDASGQPLVNGNSYTLYVRAVNGKGTGPEGSRTGIPVGVPGTPVVSAAVNNFTITYSWPAVAANGSPITDYQYSYTSNGNYTSLGSSATSINITVDASGQPLTFGSSVTIYVRAINGVGSGLFGSATGTIPLARPSPPTLTSATGFDASINLTWTTPTSTGGSPITEYQYTTDTGSTYRTLGAGNSATIGLNSAGVALVNGTTYTVSIVAINAVNSSLPSNSLTPTPTAAMVVIITVSSADVTNHPVYLPLQFTAGQTVSINWGDGTTPDTWNSGAPTHRYLSANTYTLSITGTADVFGSAGGRFGIKNNAGGAVAVVSVSSWLQSLRSLSYLFSSQPGNFTVPTYLPPNASNISYMFQNAAAFNQPLNSWNTSTVVSMNNMFQNAAAFNRPLNSWITTNVTSMSSMFSGAVAFNQPLNSWITTNVTSMTSMFSGAEVFNQPLNLWSTAKVTDMSEMFSRAYIFNQNITSWVLTQLSAASSIFAAAPIRNSTQNWPPFITRSPPLPDPSTNSVYYAPIIGASPPTNLSYTTPPRIGTATLELTWGVPLNDGGSAITRYWWSTDNGATYTGVNNVLQAQVNGLQFNTNYNVKVYAQTDVIGLNATAIMRTGPPF